MGNIHGGNIIKNIHNKSIRKKNIHENIRKKNIHENIRKKNKKQKKIGGISEIDTLAELLSLRSEIEINIPKIRIDEILKNFQKIINAGIVIIISDNFIFNILHNNSITVILKKDNKYQKIIYPINFPIEKEIIDPEISTVFPISELTTEDIVSPYRKELPHFLEEHLLEEQLPHLSKKLYLSEEHLLEEQLPYLEQFKTAIEIFKETGEYHFDIDGIPYIVCLHVNGSIDCDAIDNISQFVNPVNIDDKPVPFSNYQYLWGSTNPKFSNTSWVSWCKYRQPDWLIGDWYYIIINMII